MLVAAGGCVMVNIYLGLRYLNARWVLRIVLSRAYPGVQRGLWPAERRLEVQREECVRGRQEASQSLPSLALGLKEINCVL